MTAAASSTRARPHGNLDPWAGRLGDPEGHALAGRMVAFFVHPWILGLGGCISVGWRAWPRSSAGTSSQGERASG
jgi:hypothetical protein